MPQLQKRAPAKGSNPAVTRNRRIVLKKMLLFCQRIFAILLISPPRKGRSLHLNELKSSLPTSVLSQDWVKLAQWFWRICIFVYKGIRPFKSFHPRMLWAKFVWNLSSDSGEEAKNVKDVRRLRRRPQTAFTFQSGKLNWISGQMFSIIVLMIFSKSFLLFVKLFLCFTSNTKCLL